ncbi:hypothetical protein DMN91_000215, partial [Ooceraea biroi]
MRDLLRLLSYEQKCVSVMLIGNFLLIAALLVVSFASGETTTYSRVSRVLGVNGDRWSRVRKRQEEPKYFEQCHSVNIWREHLGHVCVLAFLDPSWQYSFRQAVMLNVLSSRMRKSGFPDIRFFAISPPPDLTQDDTEDDEEIEAWRQIATMFPDTENFVNINADIFKEGNSEIIFLRDGPQLQIWKTFRASKDQVVVIDRCGRLTYQVIVPWSILHLPYVKATILSTCLEDPCGGCDPRNVDKFKPSQRDYLWVAEDDPARQGMFTPRKNDSANYGEMKDRVLMLDEPATGDNVTGADGISTIKMTISDDADDGEASGSDGNANNSSDNLSERGQSDSVGSYEDRDGEKTRKYTHLILRTDDPDYHGHLDSGFSVTPADSSRIRILSDHVNLQASDLQVGSNSKEHDQAGIKINQHTGDTLGDTDQNYIFDRDESPGLYGEVGDYWRSYENSDITDRNETSNDNYNNTT